MASAGGQQAGLPSGDAALCWAARAPCSALGLQEHIPHLSPCPLAINTHPRCTYGLPKATAIRHRCPGACQFGWCISWYPGLGSITGAGAGAGMRIYKKEHIGKGCVEQSISRADSPWQLSFVIHYLFDPLQNKFRSSALILMTVLVLQKR